ncbi:hypothetical protein FB562_2182 [Homoserinimonas aerilata]|uniref:Uncharacterized protein n=1 Tax=Homoserinimonas aerilata TaxID=1162970 RepID=A0A542YEY9_9MICO|nr:hypothetical protein FB562_2182 [Homoserinimonas aerilata]
MNMQRDKGRDDLLWLIMVAGLVIGGLMTIGGLLVDIGALTIVGVIFLAFGGGAMFTRLSRP